MNRFSVPFSRLSNGRSCIGYRWQTVALMTPMRRGDWLPSDLTLHGAGFYLGSKVYCQAEVIETMVGLRDIATQGMAMFC